MSQSGKVAKAQAGKLYPCKCCGKTPIVDQERYYQNISDNDTAKKVFTQNFPTVAVPEWIGCVDIECFKRQGGVYDPTQTQKNFQKSKTPEELFNYRKAFFEFCWAHAKNRAKEEIPKPELYSDEEIGKDLSGNKITSNKAKLEEYNKQVRILASSFLYAMSGSK